METTARRERAGIAVLGGLVALFVVLKLYSLRPAVGDEGIYFYLGSRAADGLVPYRDFVFVHPPMHIYLLALAARLSGSSFAVLKAAPGLFALLTGLVLWGLARRPALRTLLPGPFWPIVPVALYLFNYDTLRVSSHWVGVNQATFFALLGLLLWERGRPRLAGCAFACALATATYVTPVLAGFFLLKLPWGKAAGDDLGRARVEFKSATAAAFAATLALHLPAWILAAPQWWSQTIAFQLEKPPIGSTFGTAFGQLLAAEGFLVAGSAIWTLRLLSKRQPVRLVWLPLIGLGYSVVLSGLERVYIYYFICAVPLLALGGALLLREAAARVAEVWNRSRNEAAAALRAMAPLLIALSVQPLAYRAIPDVADDPSRIKTYAFHPTPGMGPVNAIVSALFVERRRVGFPAPGISRYLWHESTYWDEARALAREVADALGPEETLYGDSTTAPLLAFLSRRRIACELADTNTLHFRTGFRTLQEDLACARGDRLGLLVLQPRRGIGLLPEFEAFARSEGALWRDARAGSRAVQLFRLGPDGREP